MKKLLILLLALGLLATGSACFTPVESSSITSDVGSSESLNSSSDEKTGKLSITFKQNGCIDIVKKVNKGETLTDVPIPVAKTGYTVTWDKTDFTNITQEITVNAIETANQYVVTYSLNGGMLETTTQTVTFDEKTTLPTPEKEDSLFLGWTYKGKAVVSGEKWTIADNVTLIATWQDNRPSFKVTFVDGMQSKEVTVKKGESVAEADVPAFVGKTGYSVAWDKTDFSNITQDVTVTAVYTANTYTVAYNAEGYALDGTTVELTYDALCSALDMSLTNEEYNFLGWEYAGATYTKESIWNIAEENVTLVALWAEKERAVITFTDTDGSLITKNVVLGTALTDIPTPKDKVGYIVDTQNWYIDSECTMVAAFENVQENNTVYAKAVAKTYDITYNANGGSADVTTQQVVYDEDYRLTTPTNALLYMRFDGWKDENGAIIAMEGTWTMDSNVRLTAQWTDTRATFTVSFVQASQETKVFNVKEGESFMEIPAYVEKIGYNVKWDEEAVAKLENITENIVVNAVETAKTYTIIFNVNGGLGSVQSITVTYGEAYSLVKPEHVNLSFRGWQYNETAVASTGVWNLDIEGDTLELVAKWGNAEWSKFY